MLADGERDRERERLRTNRAGKMRQYEAKARRGSEGPTRMDEDIHSESTCHQLSRPNLILFRNLHVDMVFLSFTVLTMVGDPGTKASQFRVSCKLSSYCMVSRSLGPPFSHLSLLLPRMPSQLDNWNVLYSAIT